MHSQIEVAEARQKIVKFGALRIGQTVKKIVPIVNRSAAPLTFRVTMNPLNAALQGKGIIRLLPTDARPAPKLRNTVKTVVESDSEEAPLKPGPGATKTETEAKTTQPTKNATGKGEIESTKKSVTSTVKVDSELVDPQQQTTAASTPETRLITLHEKGGTANVEVILSPKTRITQFSEEVRVHLCHINIHLISFGLL